MPLHYTRDHCANCKHAIEQVNPRTYWCVLLDNDNNKHNLTQGHFDPNNKKCLEFKWKKPITKIDKIHFLAETLGNNYEAN
jgi:hypothetical protein